MTETPTGARRLKGLLPVGTVVAHKTGSSGTVNGLTAATNDVGIIQLPNGRYLAIAVFVSDSTADEAAREAVIAEVARAAWEFWNGHEGGQARRPERKGHLLPTKFNPRSNLKATPSPVCGERGERLRSVHKAG